jgi:hypothetical protein
MKARPDETILAAGTHRSSPVAASAVAPHVAEHVVADLEVADFGVAIGLLAGAVFVDVTIGPVPAELRTAGRQLADQCREFLVQRIATGFESKHRRGQAARQRPVLVEVGRAGVEEDEAGQVRSLGLEDRCEQRSAQQVRGHQVLVGVVDDGGDLHVVEEPLHRLAHRSRARRVVVAGRVGWGVASEVEEVVAFDIVELQGSRDALEHAPGGVADVAALEPGAVVGADAGEHGDFLPA